MKKIAKIAATALLSVFGLTAITSCGEEPVNQDLLTAQEAVGKVMFIQEDTKVASDFTIVSSVKVAGTAHTVTWASSDESLVKIVVADGVTTIDIQPGAPEEGKDVTLTATVTVNNESASQTYKITVLPEAGVSNVAKVIADIMEISSKDNAINVELENLTVVGLLSGNAVLADESGCIYAYGLSKAGDDTLVVGDIVNVSAISYRYYGCPQLANVTATKVGSDSKLDLTTKAVTKTITELVNFDVKSTTSMDPYTSYYKVNAKIRVVTDAQGSTNVLLTDPQNQQNFVVAYYKCSDVKYLEKLDGQTYDLYVNMYDNYANYDYGKATYADGTEIGTKTVNRVFYFAGNPTGEVEDPSAPVECTVTEALALEKGTQVIMSGIVKSIDTAWSDQYKNITVTVTDGKSDLQCFRLATNVQVGDEVVVTGTTDEYKGTKQIAAAATAEIKAKYVTKTIAEAVASDDGTKVMVAGKVKKIDTAWSDSYKNITVTITDGTTDLYVFRTNTNLVVDDEVIIVGKVGSYNGSKQIAAGSFAIITKKAATEGGNEGGAEETPSTPVIENATVALLKGKAENDAFTLDAAIVTGKSDNMVFIATANGGAAINYYGKTDVYDAVEIGKVYSVSGKVTKGTGGGTKNMLCLGADTVLTEVTATVATPTFTAIDYSTKGYDWLCSLAADTTCGGYVEFTNVKFSTIEENNWSKLVTPNEKSEYAGLYKSPTCEDGTETKITTEGTYTIKCYILGTNAFDATKDAQTKIRLYAVSIVKTA